MAISQGRVEFELGEKIEGHVTVQLTLVLSIFKFDRMEWAIEKATELGVERIVPIIARRSEKHLAQSAQNRVERWRRIAREAAQQSRRSDVPVTEDAVVLKTAARREGQAVRLLLAEQERTRTLRGAIDDALSDSGNDLPATRLAVGPEGGWVAEEEALFDSEGWKPVSLGPRILRAETAAITAMAVIAALLE
jgi:16S rRNA (uracil1498-N3)-methyltransferase